MPFRLKYEKANITVSEIIFSSRKQFQMYYGNLTDRQSFCPKGAQVFVQSLAVLFGIFKNEKFLILFGKVQRTSKNIVFTNIKKFSGQTSKFIRRNFPTKNITASKVFVDTWNEVLTTLPKFFCQKTKHFLTAVKKQYGSINFCQKVYVFFELCHGHKKSSFDKLPEKSDTESSKSFCTISEFRSKMKHSCKIIFLVRSFICTCSMQFSQASREFLPAVWKIPAQKPQLIVETNFCSETISFLKEWLRKSTRYFWR